MDGYLISEMDLLFPLSTYPVGGVGGTGGIMFSRCPSVCAYVYIRACVHAYVRARRRHLRPACRRILVDNKSSWPFTAATAWTSSRSMKLGLYLRR